MNGFAVDTDRLRAVARRLDDLVGESREHSGLRYTGRPELVGDTELAAALARFQEASGTAIRTVLADAAALAERMSAAADRYDEYEDGPLLGLLRSLG